MTGLSARAGILVATALLLGGCTSARIGSPGSAAAASARPGPVYSTPEPLEPAPAVPAGSVSSSPLEPPPGAVAAPVQGATPGPVASLDPTTTPGGGMAPAPVAAPVAPAVPAPASSSRSSVVGSWNAREAGGGACRVTLSSAPSLDLYRASTTGCQGKDLAAVSAWDFRDGEVYLYQKGGTVAARLRTASGQLDGVLAKSGAPLTLSR